MPRIIRYSSKGMDIVKIVHNSFSELYITRNITAGEKLENINKKLYEILRSETNIFVTKVKLFTLSDNLVDRFKAQNPDWPLTAIKTECCRAGSIAKFILHAVAGIQCKRLYWVSRPVGSFFENDRVKCCLLSDIRSDNVNDSHKQQTKSVFETMDSILHQVGMSFSNVIRTWFYNAAILDWYSCFNGVRGEFFRTHIKNNEFIPASTGVGGKNFYSAALLAEAIAISAKNNVIKVAPVSSPLQNPAYDYSSIFSRAVEISMPGYEHLLISGTASIGLNGGNLYSGNVMAQINQTMRVVKAILNSKNMSFENITRTIIYLKDYRDEVLLGQTPYLQQVLSYPFLIAQADICRDELLFEIEMDAVSSE